jgi:adenylate cyclase
MPTDNDGSHERKLVTILAADVAGYSRLMADDEVGTMRTLTDYREVFSEHVAGHKGRIVDTTGDSVLAVFESVVEAVQAAVDIQRDLGNRNETIAGHRKMHFRIGVNLGDIIVRDDGTVYGDGVNVAARLEALAEPGGVMVSEDVHKYVEGKLDVGLEDAGEHDVKNIRRPVRAYRILSEGEAAAPKSRRPMILAGLVGALVVVVGLVGWQYFGSAIFSPLDDPGLAVADGPSIAVLPFDNMSDDPEHEYFADGLTEELITALSRFQDMKVIARHSTLGYKGAVDVRAVATDLGVRYVVEGSVRRGAENVRVTVQLLDGGDGSHVWSETYDRPLTAANLFAIQDEVTAKIVGRIAGRYGVLNKDEIVASRDKPTESLSAYECVLRSYAYLEVLTAEEHAATRDCLERAVMTDPNYAEAWAWLGNRAAEEHALGFNPRPNAAERALEANRRAVALDAENQAVRYTMAWTLFFFGELDEFVAETDLAVALNPNNAVVLADLGNMLRYAGQRDRGMAMMEKAIELNPHHPGWFWLNIAHDSFVRGDYRGAVKYAKQSKMPTYMSTLLTLTAAYGQLGETELAGETVANIQQVSPDYTIENFHERARRWRYPAAFTERYVQGLKKAGLPEALHGPSRPVIAVLPFDNMSGDPEQEYFADGITEDIITRLAQYPNILVLGRNTTFQFKGQAVDIPTIADKLKADYVVEGSIRRGGDTVRVTAQLLGADGGTHIWAETYDVALDPENLFSIQDVVTQAIASRIGDPYGEISRDQFQLFERQSPTKLSSYECVLRYFDYVRNINADRHSLATKCLEDVVEAEPDFGLAHAFLADMYIDDVALGFEASANASLKKALELVERGVQAERNDGRIRIRMARALMYTNNVERARNEAEGAIALSPNDVDVLSNASEVFSHTGAYDRAAKVISRIEVLNPNYPNWLNWHPAFPQLVRGEYADVIRRIERSHMDWSYWTHAFVAAAHCADGNIEEGQNALRRALELEASLADIYWQQIYFWHRGPEVRPLLDALASGLEACGWDLPPDPGREAFAARQ